MTRATTQSDQRRFRRYVLNLPCRVKPRKSVKRSGLLAELRTETQDVSGGGLFFVAPAEWIVGTELEVELYLPASASGEDPVAIRCRGKVARVVPQEEGRVGVGATIEQYRFFHPKETPPETVS